MCSRPGEASIHTVFARVITDNSCDRGLSVEGLWVCWSDFYNAHGITGSLEAHQLNAGELVLLQGSLSRGR